MTTLLKPDIRRSPREPGRRAARPLLEMPVLFQLADLSPAQAKASSLASTPLFGSPAPAPEPPPREPAAILFQPVPTEVPAPAEVSKELAIAPPAPSEEVTAEATPEPVLASAILPASEPESKEAEPSSPASLPAADSVLTTSGPPAAAAAPTPRERAEQRAKNRQAAPAKSDWMRTHGKYIAVVFVIALIATIYAAQNGDEPAPARSETGSTSEQAEAPADDDHLDFSHIHSAKESTPAAESQRSPALAESSPAAQPEAHAELLPPAQGAAIKEPVSEEVAESKSLFPWKGAGETRIASKPDDGRKGASEARPAATSVEETSPAATGNASTNNAATNNTATNNTATGNSAPAEEAPSIYGPPTGMQTEPAAEPPRGAPPAGDGPKLNAPTVYPVTNPSSYRINEPAARPGAGGQQTMPASFEKSPTRTSGPRNERTGSGLY